MKKRFLSYIKKEVKNSHKEYDSDKIDEIMYGVEGLYLTVTKAIIIFLIAIVLGIFKELILLLVLYNFVRLFAFGMHAAKSWHCLIFSLLIFLVGAYLSQILIIQKLVLYLLYTVAFIVFILYAPADTEKRPLINKKRRIRYKVLSICVLILYFIVSLLIKNNLIINTLIISILIESILILPITYKVFKLPYKNYKTYGLDTIRSV